MELDQILKRLDWLDEERRKDKSVISALQDRVQGYESSLEMLNQQIKGLSTEVTRLTTMLGRMDQYDEALLQQRVESKRRDDEMEKQFRKSLEESEKVRRVEMRGLDVQFAELRKGLEPIPELRRNINTRLDDILRLDRSIEEVRQKIEEVRRIAEEQTRSARLVEESRRQDNKRLTDLQGELSAVRKRTDEMRAQQELTGNNFRKIDTRLNELMTVEAERRESQKSFLEQQTLWQLERDRAWKDLQARFDAVEAQSGEVGGQLQIMESTHQVVKRNLESLESLTERVERRINEITEIQRLGEERFRQEWVTFKADDQKRWTNYTLSQDEQRSETVRQFEKLIERVTALEDLQQDVQDLLRQVNEQTEKRLQSLLALAHEWVSNYERLMGQVR